MLLLVILFSRDLPLTNQNVWLDFPRGSMSCHLTLRKHSGDHVTQPTCIRFFDLRRLRVKLYSCMLVILAD